MGESVVLLSSYEMTREELSTVLLKAGGVYQPDGGCLGYLYQGKCFIIITTGEHTVREYLFDYLEIMKSEALEVLEEIKAKLGGEPQAYIDIEISRIPGSGKLAVEFAYSCAEIWPCVVDTLEVERHIYSKEEMMLLRKEGRGFTAYGM